MAFPRASTYTRTLDTLASMSLDTRTTDVHSTVTDFGEKFIKTLNNKGRVFVVNDAEGLRHPVASTGSEDITYFTPDNMGAGSAAHGGAFNFGTQAKDPLTQIQFTMPVAAININFPQAMPAGDLVSYVDTRIKMTMIDLFNREENLLLTGQVNNDGVSRYISPFYGDSTYGIDGGDSGTTIDRAEKTMPEPGLCTNLPSFFMGGTTQSGTEVSTGSFDAKGEMFAGIKLSDFPTAEFDQPLKTALTTSATINSATDGRKLSDDLQKAILTSTYSETERPTDIWTTLELFTRIVHYLREDGALPNPVVANMGKEGTIPFGGLHIDWHRYLAADKIWNPDDEAIAQVPILGINFNSLRLNLVKRGGGMAHDEVGMFESVGEMELAHQLPILYKRVQWKRMMSWDKGRRSSFMLTGATSIGALS
jgi:hypothetical protein